MMTIVTALFFGGCGNDDAERYGSIFGNVTDVTVGEPMRNTGVALYRRGDFGQFTLVTRTVTGNDGQFEFREIEAGNYRLNVEASGHTNTTHNVEVSEGRASRMDMHLERIPTQLTVRTLELTNVGGNSATLHGNATPEHSGTALRVTEVGFVYATHNNPANGGTRVTATGTGTFTTTFATTITGLAAGTFYVQAYAVNSIGTEFGEVRSFVITGAPVVTTLAATNVTANAATLNGRIDFAGDPAFTERGFVFSSTFQNPTTQDDASATTRRVVAGTGVGDFSVNVTGLTAINYHIRAFATNSNGTVYGETVTTGGFIVLQADGIMVQNNDISAGADWNTANNLCQSSNVGGFSDWRVPTLGELTSLYNQRTAIGGFAAAWYWSSTARWARSFEQGRNGEWGVSNTHRVRCVRTLP